jgi:lipopolysaccharide/colanic/teichoic acid biosynthesis glycosyltransferase
MEGAKPGFIGPWWLVGQSRPNDVEREVAHDLHYLRNYSIWLDFHILIQVARALVNVGNAPLYAGPSTEGEDQARLPATYPRG